MTETSKDDEKKRVVTDNGEWTPSRTKPQREVKPEQLPAVSMGSQHWS